MIADARGDLKVVAHRGNTPDRVIVSSCNDGKSTAFRREDGALPVQRMTDMVS